MQRKRQKSAPPVIIKRIKKIAAPPFSAKSWKVAYADFVTAMMAFFLLLWIISSTTTSQKKGISDYFAPPMGLLGNEGNDSSSGKHLSTDPGSEDTELSALSIISGHIRQGPEPKPSDSAAAKKPKENAELSSPLNDRKKASGDKDAEQFKMIAQALKQALEKDPEMEDMLNNVIVQDAPDGLKIDIIDSDEHTLFIPTTSTISANGKQMIDSMLNIINKTPNPLAITGHTGSLPDSNANYSNWELSADRANAVRRYLGGMLSDKARIVKVIGMADRELLTPQEPVSVRNNRITITFIRGAYSK